MKTFPKSSAELIELLDKEEGPLDIRWDTPHEMMIYLSTRRNFINDLKRRLKASQRENDNNKEIIIGGG